MVKPGGRPSGMAYNSERELDWFLESPFASTMDLTEVFSFWRKLETKEIFLALFSGSLLNKLYLHYFPEVPSL